MDNVKESNLILKQEDKMSSSNDPSNIENSPKSNNSFENELTSKLELIELKESTDNDIEILDISDSTQSEISKDKTKLNSTWKKVFEDFQKFNQSSIQANDNSQFPEWKKIPGTNFYVDAFQGYKKINCTCWFLTHFHYDHYMGLDRHFDKGKIFCTPVTAKLVHLRIKVPMEFIETIEINETRKINGIDVTFVDANHCPGAAMIIFKRFNSIPILHTGDARLDDTVISNRMLENLRGKKAKLILDTTYCNPKHVFPPQKDTIEHIQAMMKMDLKRTLILVGTYTVGKERVFFEVARCLKTKVYVNPAKQEILNCLELTEEEKNLITNDKSETYLQTIEMSRMNYRDLNNILRQNKDEYDKVIGIKTAGRVYENTMSNIVCHHKQSKKDDIMIYELPYSEHSSYNELLKFVNWMHPVEIIPSVGNVNSRKCRTMLGYLTQRNIDSLFTYQKKRKERTSNDQIIDLTS